MNIFYFSFGIHFCSRSNNFQLLRVRWWFKYFLLWHIFRILFFNYLFFYVIFGRAFFSSEIFHLHIYHYWKCLSFFGIDIPYLPLSIFSYTGKIHSKYYSFFRVFLRIISSLMQYLLILILKLISFMYSICYLSVSFPIYCNSSTEWGSNFFRIITCLLISYFSSILLYSCFYCVPFPAGYHYLLFFPP